MQGISVVIPFYCGNSYFETMAEQLKKNINNFKFASNYLENDCAVDCKYYILKKINL